MSGYIRVNYYKFTLPVSSQRGMKLFTLNALVAHCSAYINLYMNGLH